MREPAMLFEPIVNIRDVLESFLVDRVVLSDWRGTLTSASARLVELGRAWSDNDLLELGHVTKHLAAESLLADSALARTAAQNAARLLDQVRIPGMPHPDARKSSRHRETPSS